MGKKLSYTEIAEKDYQYLRKDVEDGRISNLIAYSSQNICERYLKGIIVARGLEEKCDNNEMISHSVRKLSRFLQKNAKDLKLDYETIGKADGYYINARYPGDDYFDVTEEDIKGCWEAVEEARKVALTLEMSKEELDRTEAKSILGPNMKNAVHTAIKSCNSTKSEEEEHDLD